MKIGDLVMVDLHPRHRRAGQPAIVVTINRPKSIAGVRWPDHQGATAYLQVALMEVISENR